jgi:hypothetical protein
VGPSDRRAREIDDGAAPPEPPSRLLVDDERPADVRAVHAVERCEVELGHRSQDQHSGRVHHDVDAAVRLLRSVEQTGAGILVRDVDLHRHRLSTVGNDRGHHGAGKLLVAQVPNHDGRPVGGQTVGRRPGRYPASHR